MIWTIQEEIEAQWGNFLGVQSGVESENEA